MKIETIILILMAGVGGLLLGFSLGSSTCQRAWEKSAIAHGFAEYNSTNRMFQWKSITYFWDGKEVKAIKSNE